MKLSVVVVNYNGGRFLERCLSSLRAQTVPAQVVVADNDSTDGSAALAVDLLRDFPDSSLVQTGLNAGFSYGANLGARECSGDWLLFLNPDAWLEPDCAERVLEAAERTGAEACGLRVLDYGTYRFQNAGGRGFDVFGFGLDVHPEEYPDRLWVPNGFVAVRADAFWDVGGFDARFFMYGEETDLAWRLWATGRSVAYAPQAVAHHYGSGSSGEKRVGEIATSETKRYYTDRNLWLCFLKCASGPAFLGLALNAGYLLLESLVASLWLRRWSYFRRTWWQAVVDCWGMREHVLEERRKLAPKRKRGDLWLLRFLRPGLGRWLDYRRALRSDRFRVED